MGQTEFPSLVEKNFDFLIKKYGYHIKSTTYTGFPLSEWIIVLCSNDLCVAISLDKAQVIINLAIPDKENTWLGLMFVMMYIFKNFEWKYIRLTGEINANYYDRQLKQLSQVLQENLELIKDAVTRIANNQRERRQFDKLVREYFSRLMLDL